MTKMVTLALLAGSLLLVSSCVVREPEPRHGRHNRGGARVEVHHTPPPEPAEPPPEPAEPPPPEPDRTPPPPEPVPPPHHHPHAAVPGLTVTVPVRTARRGETLEIHLHPYREPVLVHINGRLVPKRINGNVLTVTVPGNAPTGPGHVVVLWQDRPFPVPVEIAP